MATGGTEWSTLESTKRFFLFQCTIASAAIARGGAMAPSTLRQSWQQQPSANSKRGKPHCHAAFKAGLCDEPQQMAGALVAGF